MTELLVTHRNGSGMMRLIEPVVMNQRKRRWLIYWSIWILLGLYMSSMDQVMFPKAAYWPYLLPMNLMQNLVFGCAGLGVLALAQRWPLEHFSWGELKNWVIHLVGSIILAMIGLWFVWRIALAFGSANDLGNPAVHDSEAHSYLHMFSGYFHIYLLFLWAVLGAFHFVRFFDRYRKREMEAVQLESRLAAAQTQALQMQLQPHFLFNTLNSIVALIHSDAEAADRMVSRLADLLRMTLDSGAKQEVSLRQEMAFTDAYLGIERIRFQDRLTIIKDVPADCLDALVPAFLLQPLAENAIKHGVADMAEPSTIEIRARRDQKWLTLEVIDNGRGVNGNRKSGIGTQNTSTRLQLMYNDHHTFALHSLPGQGTRAMVCIPWSLEKMEK